MSEILWNWLTVRGVHSYDVRHLAQAIDFLDATKSTFPQEQMVGSTYQPEDVNEALAAAENGSAIRILVTS